MDSNHPIKSTLTIVTVFLFLVGFNAVTALDKAKISYPTGYRDWTHAKSMVILDEKHPLFDSSGGTHHLYVNSKGLKAYRNGGTFPDGTVIVLDLLETKAEQGAYAEGPRKLIGVMQKDSRKFRETGGWGFGAFEKDTRTFLVRDGGKSCFDCHSGQKQRDFVFSTYRP